jgi:hypothetical protein
LRKNSTKGDEEEENWSLWSTTSIPDHSLGGYSHRERWSRTRWRIISRRLWMEKRKKILSP